MHNNIIPFFIKKSKKKIQVTILFKRILSLFTKNSYLPLSKSHHNYTIRIFDFPDRLQPQGTKKRHSCEWRFGII